MLTPILATVLLTQVPAYDPYWAVSREKNVELKSRRKAAPQKSTLTLEEQELARKRLPPAVWFTAVSGGALVAGGTAFFLRAKQDEARLLEGDVGITTDAELNRITRQGKVHQLLGLSLVGTGAVLLGSACVMLYSGLVPRAPAVTLLPMVGNGGAAVSLHIAF